MAIQTASLRQTLATAYGNAALYGALYSTVPSATAGTEISGGTPAYARKPLTWTGTNGTITATATFDVPNGATVAGAGVHSALTAGTYLDGSTVTTQAFSSQGTYTVTYSYTQS